MAKKPRLLVVSPDVVGLKMAGPGIRYVEIAKALSVYMPVAFAVGIEGSTKVDFDDSVKVHTYTHVDQLKKLIDSCDVIFCQMIDRNAVIYALSKGKRVVYDFYNALPVETIGAERISGYTGDADKDREFTELLNYFEFCSQTGSYFVCSNPRQRDWWLGFIMASRGLKPSNLHARNVDQIIDFTPFGMASTDPVQTSHPLRDKPGIDPNDFILLWAGGIWDWFDAQTPIRAVAELANKHPDIKLIFYGTVHPNSSVGKPKNVKRAMALAKELGVIDKQIFFHDGWVPFNDRQNYLLDADVALSSHVESLETSYAFRTRILDHFWATLPSIVTRGDWFADYIESKNLGLVTECVNLEQTKNAILELYNNEPQRAEIKQNISSVRDDWRWTATTASLRNFLLNSIMDTPLLSPPLHIQQAAPQTFIGALKQSKATGAVRKTPLWPMIRKLRRRI